MFLGWIWLDPVMGIVGALVITRWAWDLLRDTSAILLDSSAKPATVQAVRSAIEADADNRVADVHVWQVGQQHLAVIVSVVSHYPQPPEHYKLLLRDIPNLAHISVEVHACSSEPCLPQPVAAK